MPRLHLPPIPASDITPESLYLTRRQWMAAAGAAAGGLLLPAGTATAAEPASLGKLISSPFSVGDSRNSYDQITQYNNFYEFGTDKSDPAENAHTLKTRPWTVEIGGEVQKPRRFDLDELLKLAPLEERVYRLRCVEGWSMVIPWVGYSLAEVLKRVEPTSRAKFVEFTSLAAADQMPGVRSRVLAWPYTEGLRIDEAMHPLTMLVMGLYGKLLPNQNGAPIRLAVPWKYGFKSAKSLVRIRLVEQMPQTSWNRAAPSEYGFFSNVNPEVDHPRWSQASERRIGEFLKRKTLMFNGYVNDVGKLYSGMDLRRNF
ncbi:protein-methionine-sulfoxide reductase catalytic subunit MsrP [Parachitinimonas caeni]|uniref:Protein-methionine-sulfoxide reductase catalytic subunit MsrP n=1 Tax=Parachitinimonas caeni TaxID=3031301 RepID=A0ABT7DR58_9NEIS|nr:protein-methionine-sulfoxide reductase catalytic subunit MsrP [Parachitinimonas caeni]MDK2122444.1 protein-methionine-sulfoxide reductase catalytic subunit MsrP [Parachitinimonas caeni]